MAKVITKDFRISCKSKAAERVKLVSGDQYKSSSSLLLGKADMCFDNVGSIFSLEEFPIAEISVPKHVFCRIVDRVYLKTVRNWWEISNSEKCECLKAVLVVIYDAGIQPTAPVEVAFGRCLFDGSL